MRPSRFGIKRMGRRLCNKSLDPDGIELAEHSLVSSERRFGRNDPITVSKIEALASRLSAAGRTHEAITLLREAVDLRIETVGVDHPDALRAEVWLAQNLAATGMYREAAPLFLHSINVNADSLRSETAEHFETMVWLGMTLTHLASDDVAQIFLQQAISGLGRRYGPDDRATLRASAWLARSLAQESDYAAALRLRETILESFGRQFGPGDEDALRAMWNLAYLLHLVGRDAEAKALLQSFVDTKTRIGKGYDDETSKVKDLLAAINGNGAPAG